ncbi:hypothetical protein G9A89_005743 [Geosiphon pyriformis]|nr:hypothetical protein G9A89_005743 [Geosiphon pyriformis]
MQQQFPITYADKDFGAAIPWELSEKKEEGSEDQGFIYQNPISENLEFETPNFQTPINPNLKNSENATSNIQTLQNSKQINQNNLPLNIVINQPPIDPIAKPIHQLIQQPHQPNQPPLQQPAQQPLQPPPQQFQQLVQQQMAYTPIAKLENLLATKTMHKHG